MDSPPSRDATPSGSNQANTAASREFAQPAEHESRLPPLPWIWRKVDRAEAFQPATHAQESAKQRLEKLARRGSPELWAVSPTFETASSKDDEARGSSYACPYQKLFPTLGPFCGMPNGWKSGFGWNSITGVKYATRFNGLRTT
jgi:hypothetical protein